MTVLEEPPAPTTATRDITARLVAIAGLAVLFVAALSAAAIALNSHVHGVYAKKDDAYRALAIRSDGLLQRTKAADAKAKVAAVTKAVATQRAHDGLKLKHKVAALLKQRKKAVAAAFKRGQQTGYSSGYGAGNSAGYSSGQSAGYSSGHSEGVFDGEVQASDQLDCSDDPDVTWLPYCN